MEGLGIAANVIAVIDLSVKVADWCVEYCKSVKNAKDDIVRFRLEVIGLQTAANGVKELLAGPSGERLKTSTAMQLRPALRVRTASGLRSASPNVGTRGIYTAWAPHS